MTLGVWQSLGAWGSSSVVESDRVTAFRLAQRAYEDVTKWPEYIIEDALCEADAETGGRGWGPYVDECKNFKRRGMFFYAAHWLAVTYNAVDGSGATDSSNINATARLNVAAKSVGDESVTYRVGAIQSTEDDWLSLTNYGVQYLRLRRRAGMGALAV